MIFHQSMSSISKVGRQEIQAVSYATNIVVVVQASVLPHTDLRLYNRRTYGLNSSPLTLGMREEPFLDINHSLARLLNHPLLLALFDVQLISGFLGISH